MLNSYEKSYLRQLIQSSQWKVIERLSQMVIDKIKDEPLIKENESETLKTVYLNEGQKQGIRRFLQEIILNAQNE